MSLFASSEPAAAQPSGVPETRQQLDELDALLQRMLALPVEPAEALPPADAGADQRSSLLAAVTAPPAAAATRLPETQKLQPRPANLAPAERAPKGWHPAPAFASAAPHPDGRR